MVTGGNYGYPGISNQPSFRAPETNIIPESHNAHAQRKHARHDMGSVEELRRRERGTIVVDAITEDLLKLY